MLPQMIQLTGQGLHHEYFPQSPLAYGGSPHASGCGGVRLILEKICAARLYLWLILMLFTGMAGVGNSNLYHSRRLSGIWLV